MHRSRIGLLSAFALGALSAAVALPVAVSGCRRHGELAADARAEPLAAPAPAPAVDRQPGTMPSLSPLVKQLRPVVVNVFSRVKPRRVGRVFRQRPRPFVPPDEGDEENEDPMERFFRFFGPPGRSMPDEQERHGLGSGFLIGDGLVITNNHVVAVQDQPGPNPRFRPVDEIKVQTDPTSPGGSREFSAKVIGNDWRTDIALLRIEGEHVKELKAAVLGDSDAMEVGDYVIAIGEPFGLQATVTSGIISAKERTQLGGPYENLLQTDASINPGNSGGPLFNLRGEVVGVNTAIISGANTIGFAVPSAVVKQILPQLKEKGRVSRGFLGVQPQMITQDVAERLGLKSTQGALLAEVVKKSPAESAGLKPGDVVTGLNGKPIADANQLTRDVGAIPPGKSIKLDVIHDGKSRQVEVKLGGRPDEKEEGERAEGDRGGEASSGDPLGLSVRELTPELARRAQVDEDVKGVFVTDVDPDSPAASAGVEPGSILVEVNRQPINSVADYRKAVKGLKKGDTALLRVRRGQGAAFLAARIK